MSALSHLLAALALALASTAIAAQSVYRCGNEYTRVPCAKGKSVDVDNRTTAAQRAEAREVARREKELGADMARERREENRTHRPALATSLGARPASAPAPTAHVKKKSKSKKAVREPDDRDFTAAPPRPKKP